MEAELLRWVVSQGALAAVLIIIVAWWRSDFKRFQLKDEQRIDIFIDIIKHNTESNIRLAELIERYATKNG